MSTPPSPPSSTTEPAAAAAGDLPGAAGPGYAREWALFCDYTTATDQPTLPATVEALVGFLRALPAAPTTTARRIRAIAAVHRGAGHLLARPDTGPAAPATRPRQPGRPDPGALLAACPTRGWPHGLSGRRDAFLIVLVDHLELTHHQAREIAPAEITEHETEDGDPVLAIRGQAVPRSDDPRSCAACAVVRWLEVLSDLDGLGRGNARATLTAAHVPTVETPHRRGGVVRVALHLGGSCGHRGNAGAAAPPPAAQGTPHRDLGGPRARARLRRGLLAAARRRTSGRHLSRRRAGVGRGRDRRCPR